MFYIFISMQYLLVPYMVNISHNVECSFQHSVFGVGCCCILGIVRVCVGMFITACLSMVLGGLLMALNDNHGWSGIAIWTGLMVSNLKLSDIVPSKHKTFA